MPNAAGSASANRGDDDTRSDSQAHAVASGIGMFRGHAATAWPRAKRLAGLSNMDFKTRNFA
ncbi:hypothetical protein GCM10023307_00060 [Lysobacter hankyongensis]|uniref:Uncharacterized protein n=1 Tax=Lysobacter hankyongensis TaxID=1176535 RepID=A0ABP9AEL8_9GAMM